MLLQNSRTQEDDAVEQDSTKSDREDDTGANEDVPATEPLQLNSNVAIMLCLTP